MIEKGSKDYERLKTFVLDVFDGVCMPDMDPKEVLSTNPNDWDADPSPFYNTLIAVFGFEDGTYFSGYGGKVQETIDFIAERWDGGELPSDDAIPWDGE